MSATKTIRLCQGTLMEWHHFLIRTIRLWKLIGTSPKRVRLTIIIGDLIFKKLREKMIQNLILNLQPCLRSFVL